MKGEPKRLLIIACSARKQSAPGKMPAIERYDGILFRVLKRWMRLHREPKPSLDILILSAEYGLIDPETPIPYYDRKMDTVRAMEIAPTVVAQLAQHTRTSSYREVFLAMGLLYRHAVEPVQAWLPPETRLIVPKGGIGTVAARLKEWLERGHSA